MQKEVLAIVVTYNRKELLLECIDALKNQTYNDLKILIVNNNSTDDTQETVEKLSVDNLEIVNTGKNLGGAGGFNFGLKYGYEHYQSHYFWLMDDDTVPTTSALEELIKSTDVLKDDFGFLSSKALWTDGSICKMNAQTAQDEEWIKDCDLINNGMVRITSSTFVSCFFKRDCLEKVGLPIKEFYFRLIR